MCLIGMRALGKYQTKQKQRVIPQLVLIAVKETKQEEGVYIYIERNLRVKKLCTYKKYYRS